MINQITMKPDNINERDTELIEKYFDGELTEEEVGIFEKRLSEDNDFKALFRFRKEIPDLWVKVRSFEAVKEEITKILDTEPIPVAKQVIRKIRFFWSNLRILKSFRNEIRRIFETEPVPQEGRSFVFILSTHKYSIAAASVLIFGLTFLFVINSHRDFDHSFADKSRNEILKVHQPEISAYKGKLEVYIGQEDKYFISPEPNADFSQNDFIEFQWNSLETLSNNNFIIQEKNSSVVVFQEEVHPYQFVLTLSAGNFKPGRYSWYIGDKNIVREFTIK
jgi:hypothetical protein